MDTSRPCLKQEIRCIMPRIQHKFNDWDSYSERKKKRILDRTRGGNNIGWQDLWVIWLFFGFMLACGIFGVVMTP
jgi:hypothetical protein